MKKAILGLFLALCIILPAARADEGMWLYNAYPKAKIKAKYRFQPSQQWLDHVRLSSVRFNNGGSGSFVSADGLTFTNHHVGAECVQELSTGGADHMETGFYAPTRDQEAKCPNLELNQLVSIEDVTSKVQSAAKPGMSAADAGKAQRSAMSMIEKDCATATGLRCDVVTFYSGQVYHLYRYKKYTDVRLVFAPEFDIAFFGGDPDNFTYPRYDLDITFFRVYENDKPAVLQNYLSWAPKGVKENDLVFVSGHPGSTNRMKTMAQLAYLCDVDYPSRLASYKRRIELLEKFSAASPENARIAKEQTFSYQNSQKAITGFEDGLKDQVLMKTKEEAEQKLRKQVDSDPKMKAEIGDPWATIETAMKAQSEMYLPLTYVDRMRGFNSELASFARTLVRVTAEKQKPSEARLREYRDSALASLEQNLFSDAPIYKSLEAATLSDSLAQMQEALGDNNPVVQKILGGRTPAEVGKDLILGTKLDSVAVRKQLYEGGAAAIEASTDPLIVLLRGIDPEARSWRKRYDDEVDSVERTAGAKVVKAQFASTGFNAPPDATFTLRLSYGAVKGYTQNGQPVPYTTTLGGAYEHAEKHGSKPPYQLPESWLKAKSNLKLNTPFNFVSTADIIGGNSGSPTVNKKGEVVGIIFDGNIESLPWNFAFEDKTARAVSVDSRGIAEALRSIYHADALADELTGKKAKPAKHK